MLPSTSGTLARSATRRAITPSLRLFFALPALHFSIQKKGHDGDEGRDEDHRDAAKRPAGVAKDVVERPAKGDEQEAMNHAYNPHGHGHAPKVFQRHRDAEQHQEGGRLNQ